MKNSVEYKSSLQLIEDFKEFDSFYWKTKDFFYKYTVLLFKREETYLIDLP